MQHVEHAVRPVWLLDVLLEQLSGLLDVGDSYLSMLKSGQHDDCHQRNLAKVVYQSKLLRTLLRRFLLLLDFCLTLCAS